MTNNKNTNKNTENKRKSKTRLYFPLYNTWRFLQEADTDSELETLPSLLALA